MPVGRFHDIVLLIKERAHPRCDETPFYKGTDCLVLCNPPVGNDLVSRRQFMRPAIAMKRASGFKDLIDEYPNQQDTPNMRLGGWRGCVLS